MEIQAAVENDTAAFRTRFTRIASALGKRAVATLAEELTLIVTGDLAMRLRNPKHTSRTARSLASTVISAHGIAAATR
ncbi:hypothetical protein [Humidisolicoccus flavus]|uniref:hypothetical protein n=1 Tax=Humidisolicoccus flavus TaxID=3111414 RepID=UPI00324E1A12